MECNHVFEGRADGVQCKLCGLHMTPDEYAQYLRSPSEEKKPEPVRRGRKKVEK